MKESKAKTKQCPQFASAISIAMVIAATQGNATSGQLTSMTESAMCFGSKCMMWESEYKLVEHEQPKDKEPPSKNGIDVDWQKRKHLHGQPNNVWFRYIQIDSGDCGLKTRELECGYPG